MQTRSFALAAVLAVGAHHLLSQPQSPGANPLTFEVTSVRPSKSDQPGGGIRPLAGGQTYVATNVPLRLMIKLMYKISDPQIAGGPSWMDTDRWDVEGKAERPSNIDQLHEMFQSLLADRFHLKFHRETRTIPAYVITVDKSGSKLKVSQGEDAYAIPIQGAGRGRIAGKRTPMNYFCWWVGQVLNMPVVDRTGLTGFYDFTLDLPQPPPPPPGSTERLTPADLAPDLFAAIREQLGLKVESRKAPAEVFVIDHVERPAAN